MNLNECIPDDFLQGNQEYLKFLQCQIGFCLVNNPRICNCQNSHLFCKYCIENWLDLNFNNTCPISRQYLNKSLLKHVPCKIYQMIENSKVICNGENCKWQGVLGDLHKHLSQQCSFYQNLYCTECQVQFFSQDAYQQHELTKLLNKNQISCRFCKEILNCNKLEEHLEICIKIQVNCEFCNCLCEKQSLYQHLEKECLKCPLECKICKKIMIRSKIQSHKINQCEFAHRDQNQNQTYKFSFLKFIKNFLIDPNKSQKNPFNGFPHNVKKHLQNLLQLFQNNLDLKQIFLQNSHKFNFHHQKELINKSLLNVINEKITKNNQFIIIQNNIQFYYGDVNKENHPHGNGTMITINYNKKIKLQEGFFQNGQIQGSSLLIKLNLNSIYNQSIGYEEIEGQCQNGKFQDLNGNISIYKGFYKNNKKNGFGKVSRFHFNKENDEHCKEIHGIWIKGKFKNRVFV